MGERGFHPDARAGDGDAVAGVAVLPIEPAVRLAAPTIPTLLDRVRGEFGEPSDHWRYEVLLDGQLVERVIRADSWRGYVDVFPAKTKVAELKQYARKFGAVEIRERARG